MEGANVMTTATTSFERPRIEIGRAAPPLHRALVTLGNEVELDPPLRELVNVRASIVNGCAYCIDKHTKIARRAGESEQRLHALAAWHDAPFFDDKERAALALTDAVTLITMNTSHDRCGRRRARTSSRTNSRSWCGRSR
jgi:AhpD family alkylhydroperoxidase